MSNRSHEKGLDKALKALDLADLPKTFRYPADLILPPSCACIEVDVDISDQTILKNEATLVGTDYIYITSGKPRLALFDMDSTLIQQEVIDQLAEAVGRGAQVAAITESTMLGEVDFVESFAERVRLLRGLAEADLECIYNKLTLMPGADILTSNLAGFGVRLGIVSGGFSYFADRIGEKLGVDFVISNTLECVNGLVTGKVLSPVIDGAAKLKTLGHEASMLGVSLANTMAVGDGANDIPMLKAAGIGVAYHAKPQVREESHHCLNVHDLSVLSYIIRF